MHWIKRNSCLTSKQLKKTNLGSDHSNSVCVCVVNFFVDANNLLSSLLINAQIIIGRYKEEIGAYGSDETSPADQNLHV